MNVSVVGTGYVGLVTGACLAELGIKVLCMDTDENKIDKLMKGILPIYEPGLEELILKNSKTGNLAFTTSIKEAVENSQVIFIAVGTPTKEDDSADLRYVFAAVSEIANFMKDYKVIVTKSTVPVMTGQRIKEKINGILKSKNLYLDFDVVSNPEFLREGTAVEDFMKPDRIVIGGENLNAINIIRKLYEPLTSKGVPIIETNLETSEIIKYASNAFLATKVSFINEISNICELCNADVITVAKAMGLDNRIGSKFLNAGPGYGGSCFPKDTRALIKTGMLLGYTPQIVKAAVEVNDRQIGVMLNKIKRILGTLKGKRITVLGAAFKPETDDIRESPSIAIIKSLLKNEALISLVDPQSIVNVKQNYPELSIAYFDNLYSASQDSDAVILVTEWDDFKGIEFDKLGKLVHTPNFIDFRNVYEPSYVRSFGFTYEGVGRL